MSFKYFIGGSVFLSLALTPGAVHSAPVKIGHYVIPGTFARSLGNDSNLLIVFYVQIMPDDFVMQLHRF